MDAKGFVIRAKPDRAWFRSKTLKAGGLGEDVFGLRWGLSPLAPAGTWCWEMS